MVEEDQGERLADADILEEKENNCDLSEHEDNRSIIEEVVSAERNYRSQK